MLLCHDKFIKTTHSFYLIEKNVSWLCKNGRRISIQSKSGEKDVSKYLENVQQKDQTFVKWNKLSWIWKKPPFFISYSVRIDEHAHKVAWEISHLSEQLHDSHASHAYQSTSITIKIIIFFSLLFRSFAKHESAKLTSGKFSTHKHNTILCSAYLIELR